MLARTVSNVQEAGQEYPRRDLRDECFARGKLQQPPEQGNTGRSDFYELSVIRVLAPNDPSSLTL